MIQNELNWSRTILQSTKGNFLLNIIVRFFLTKLHKTQFSEILASMQQVFLSGKWKNVPFVCMYKVTFTALFGAQQPLAAKVPYPPKALQGVPFY